MQEMKQIKEKIRLMSTPDYDINVWSDNEGDMDASWTVNLTFYRLKYPGDQDYPESGQGFPIVDTSDYHTLKIPVMHRGDRIAEAMHYLDTLVVNSSDDFDQFNQDNMDWWSSEVVLEHPPALIKEFMDTLPRREQ
jgi:hypothetical protein